MSVVYTGLRPKRQKIRIFQVNNELMQARDQATSRRKRVYVGTCTVQVKPFRRSSTRIILFVFSLIFLTSNNLADYSRSLNRFSTRENGSFKKSSPEECENKAVTEIFGVRWPLD